MLDLYQQALEFDTSGKRGFTCCSKKKEVLKCNSRLYGSMLSVCRHFIAMTTVANYNHGNRRHFIAMATVATFSLLPSSFEVLLPFEDVVKLSVKDLNSLAKT